MVGQRIILGLAVVLLSTPGSAAELSPGATAHAFSNFAGDASDGSDFLKADPLSRNQFGTAAPGALDTPKENPFAVKTDKTDPPLFDKKLSGNYSFSIRPPARGVFDLKNNRDDFTEYRSCLSKTLNTTDSSRCNIEILLGKKFKL